MFEHANSILLAAAEIIPLPLFAFFASFIEEVIAPIPSPAVMIATGSLAALQDLPYTSLFLLGGIAALGKTVGALLVYLIARRAGAFSVKKLGRFFRITESDLVIFREKLSGSIRDYALMIGVRAFPFFPSSVVSIGSGLMGLPMKLYLISTFIGTVIRDGFYLYFGFAGQEAIGAFLRGSATIESYIQILCVVLITLVFGYLYIKRTGRSLHK